MKKNSKQTILVTGATGNIGGGAALALAKRGARVILLGRKPETLETRANSIRTVLSESNIGFEHTDIETLVIDFFDLEAVNKAADEALKRFTTIDCLILSVGRFLQDGPNILPNGHEKMFALSMLGPFQFTQGLLKKII